MTDELMRLNAEANRLFELANRGDGPTVWKGALGLPLAVVRLTADAAEAIPWLEAILVLTDV